MPRDQRRRTPVWFYTRTRPRALGVQLGVRAGKWGRCRTNLWYTSRLGSEMLKNFFDFAIAIEQQPTMIVVVGSVIFDNSTKCDRPASRSVWQMLTLPVAPHETNKPTDTTTNNVVSAVGWFQTQKRKYKNDCVNDSDNRVWKRFGRQQVDGCDNRGSRQRVSREQRDGFWPSRRNHVVANGGHLAVTRTV